MADTGVMRVLASAGNSAAARLAAMPVTKPIARFGREMAISEIEVRW